MDFKDYMTKPGEKPLDNIVQDGGFFKIFRTVGCVGDSLSSGEFESCNRQGEKGFHDYYEYSWGQYMAREAGVKVYNFSRGGMTAKAYMENFADANDFWNDDFVCQAYIIALGVNDIFNQGHELGGVSDINPDDYTKNADTFAGWYAKIIQKLKEKQPKARFFLMSMPKDSRTERDALKEAHAKLLYDMAELFDYTYVLDLFKYAPRYDDEFKKAFYLGGHMNPMGYIVTAKMVMSYIDYIVRNNPEDFSQVGFIGKGVHNVNAKW